MKSCEVTKSVIRFFAQFEGSRIAKRVLKQIWLLENEKVKELENLPNLIDSGNLKYEFEDNFCKIRQVEFFGPVGAESTDTNLKELKLYKTNSNDLFDSNKNDPLKLAIFSHSQYGDFTKPCQTVLQLDLDIFNSRLITTTTKKVISKNGEIIEGEKVKEKKFNSETFLNYISMFNFAEKQEANEKTT